MSNTIKYLKQFLFLSFIFFGFLATRTALTQDLEFASNLERSDKGGNGGSLSEIDLAGVKNQLERVRIELIEFLDSRSGKEIYSHLNIDETIDVLREANSFEVIHDRLWDKYNIERDALNYPEKLKVFINAESFVEAVDTKAIWVLVLHEAFGLANIEMNIPGDVENSYKESIKIWRFIGEDKGFRLYSEASFKRECELVYYTQKIVKNWRILYGSEYTVDHHYSVIYDVEEIQALKVTTGRTVEQAGFWNSKQKLQHQRKLRLMKEQKEIMQKLANFKQIISDKCDNSDELVDGIELPYSEIRFVRNPH